ncbi:serpin-ZX-like [Apium graveolens]|uniref:serpin-ZX-like n=1 Tax=Apium graveolens TaxID=4045 RepID=UPI003D7B6C95
MAAEHESIKDTKQSRDSQSHVSLTLAKHLLLTKQSNIVFSPISIQIVLSLLAAGSSGETLDQFLTFLKTKSTDALNYLYTHVVDLVFVDGSFADGPCLSLANGIWLDKSLSLEPSFQHVVDTLYKAVSHQADFQNKVNFSDFIYLIFSSLMVLLTLDTHSPSLKKYELIMQFEEARLLVNSWVEKETNGLVRDILPPDSLSSSTKLVLANAL